MQLKWNFQGWRKLNEEIVRKNILNNEKHQKEEDTNINRVGN